MPKSSSLDCLSQFLFDPVRYLERNPSVENTNLSPLLHYVLHGWKEKRDIGFTLSSLDVYSPQERRWIDHFIWPDYYFSQIPAELSVLVDPKDAIIHYLLVGQVLGASPNPFFDYKFFIRGNPDLIKGSVDVFLHFFRWGYKENRLFHPFWSTLIPTCISDEQGPAIVVLLDRYLSGKAIQGLANIWWPLPSLLGRSAREKQLTIWEKASRLSAFEPAVNCSYTLFPVPFDMDKGQPFEKSLAHPFLETYLCVDPQSIHLSPGGFPLNNKRLAAVLRNLAISSSASLLFCIAISFPSWHDISWPWLESVLICTRILALVKYESYLKIKGRPVVLLRPSSGMNQSILMQLSLVVRSSLIARGLDPCIILCNREDLSMPLLTSSFDVSVRISSNSTNDLVRFSKKYYALNSNLASVGLLGVSDKPVAILTGSGLNISGNLDLPGSCSDLFGSRCSHYSLANPDILVISHDACNAGSQRALLSFLQDIQLLNDNLKIKILLIKGGDMLSAFKNKYPTVVLPLLDHQWLQENFPASSLMPRAGGVVIINSIASLGLASKFKQACKSADFNWILFNHELPNYPSPGAEAPRICDAFAWLNLVVFPSPVAYRLWMDNPFSGESNQFGVASAIMPPHDNTLPQVELQNSWRSPRWPLGAELKLIGFGRDRQSFSRFKYVVNQVYSRFSGVRGLWVGASGQSCDLIHCMDNIDVDTALQESNVFVLTTGGEAKIGESYGLVAARALQLGCPVFSCRSTIVGVSHWWPQSLKHELLFDSLENLSEYIVEFHRYQASGDRECRRNLSRLSILRMRNTRKIILRHIVRIASHRSSDC